MAKVFWHMTSATKARYDACFEELAESAKEGDMLRHNQAKDTLRSLPGFPMGIHADLDVVEPIVDDVSTKIVTIGSVN